MFLCGLVDFVVSQGLKKEVTRLTSGHGDQPSDECRDHRINEQHGISDHKADGADEVQALIDPTVVVVAMVIKALGS